MQVSGFSVTNFTVGLTDELDVVFSVILVSVVVDSRRTQDVGLSVSMEVKAGVEVSSVTTLWMYGVTLSDSSG